VYFCALNELRILKNVDAINIFTEELMNLHRGQGMDLFWRETLTCPSEQAYLKMVRNSECPFTSSLCFSFELTLTRQQETGGLFRLAIKLMQAESDSDKFDSPPLFP